MLTAALAKLPAAITAVMVGVEHLFTVAH